MIVFGTEDVGPTKYLNKLEKLVPDARWICSKNNRFLIKSNKIISEDQIQTASLIVTGTSLGNTIDKGLIKRQGLIGKFASIANKIKLNKFLFDGLKIPFPYMKLIINN